jgi:AcrR family transcriptional regulator
MHGLDHLSLRTVADDVGTSARMLVYHFGSKDELMAQALEELASSSAPGAGWIARSELYSVTLRKAWAFFE